VPPRAGRNSRHPLSDGTLLLLDGRRPSSSRHCAKQWWRATSGETPN